LHTAHAGHSHNLPLFRTKLRSVVQVAGAPRGNRFAKVGGAMAGSSSVSSEKLSRYRVEKSQVEATLTLSNGTSVHGCFFISWNSRTHAGPEGVKDVLNGETGFFPFEARQPEGARTTLYNRNHVIFVALADKSEPHRDPGYDVATQRTVAMLMTNGTRLHGAVRVFRPEGRDRLSDFTRAEETFHYLEAEHATYIINVQHVVELVEEIPVP
jgi:hypothetical protein